MCNSLLCGNTYTDSLALAFVHGAAGRMVREYEDVFHDHLDETDRLCESKVLNCQKF